MNGNSENSLFAFFFSVISPVCRTNFFSLLNSPSLSLSLSLSPFDFHDEKNVRPITHTALLKKNNQRK